eukprot:2409554-Pyramimonas_sp.AAC.1
MAKPKNARCDLDFQWISQRSDHVKRMIVSRPPGLIRCKNKVRRNRYSRLSIAGRITSGDA